MYQGGRTRDFLGRPWVDQGGRMSDFPGPGVDRPGRPDELLLPAPLSQPPSPSPLSQFPLPVPSPSPLPQFLGESLRQVLASSPFLKPLVQMCYVSCIKITLAP